MRLIWINYQLTPAGFLPSTIGSLRKLKLILPNLVFSFLNSGEGRQSRTHSRAPFFVSWQGNESLWHMCDWSNTVPQNSWKEVGLYKAIYVMHVNRGRKKHIKQSGKDEWCISIRNGSAKKSTIWRTPKPLSCSTSTLKVQPPFFIGWFPNHHSL